MRGSGDEGGPAISTPKFAIASVCCRTSSGYQQDPEITTLWGFARFAYLDNPLPSLFKERLFVYLSRFCEVRYCIAATSGSSSALGRPAANAQSPIQTIEEICALVGRPLPRNEHILPWPRCATPVPSRWRRCPRPARRWKRRSSPARRTPSCRPASARLPRWASSARWSSVFERLLVFLAFVRTAHYWTEVHKELEVEQDIKDLLATHEALAECVLNDPEGGASDISRQLLDELVLLREAQRRLSAESQKGLRASAALPASGRRRACGSAMLDGLTMRRTEVIRLECALDVALDGIGRALNVDSEFDLLRDDTGRIMRFVAWRGLSDEYRQAVDGHMPGADTTTRQLSSLPSTSKTFETDPSISAYLRRCSGKRESGARFRAAGDLRAPRGKFTHFYSPTPRAFSERERTLAGFVADPARLLHRHPAQHPTESLAAADLRLRAGGRWGWDLDPVGPADSGDPDTVDIAPAFRWQDKVGASEEDVPDGKTLRAWIVSWPAKWSSLGPREGSL